MALAAGAVAAVGIAGCGGGGSKAASTPAPANTGAAAGASASPGGQRLSLTADPGGQLRFDKKTLQASASASAGAVTITLSNPAPLSHNVSIEGNGVNQMGETVAQGGTSTVSANLKPGTYTFYCSVPGHREAGMFGTLTVK